MFKVSAIYEPPFDEEMWFDLDLYNSVHVPMMAKDFAGRVPFTKIDIKINVRELCVTQGRPAVSTQSETTVFVSPLVANIYFDTRQDADDFGGFVCGPGAANLHKDLANYTNCSIRWILGEMIDLSQG